MPFAHCFGPVDSDIAERQEARIVQSWLNLDDSLPRSPFSECGSFIINSPVGKFRGHSERLQIIAQPR